MHTNGDTYLGTEGVHVTTDAHVPPLAKKKGSNLRGKIQLLALALVA